MTEVVGVPPVHPVLLVAGKTFFCVPLVVLALRAAGFNVLGRTFHAMRLPALVVAVLGVSLIVMGVSQLGASARVGLPRGETTLRTTGVYAFSRNPVYVGAMLACLASCAYVPHWLNIACTLGTAAIHHRIVLAEERFLSERFAGKWEAYRRRVRRYL